MTVEKNERLAALRENHYGLLHLLQMTQKRRKQFIDAIGQAIDGRNWCEHKESELMRRINVLEEQILLLEQGVDNDRA